MTTTASNSWQQAISDIVWQALKARTESRYDELSLRQYIDNQGQPKQRERFYKAWTSSVEEMHYRLRSAKTRRLFSAAFTQLICAHPHWKLNEHYGEVSHLLLSEERWEDLRDILMLALSARSYIKSPNSEDK